MNPGLLKHRITILRPSTSKDALGQSVSSWAVHARCWASVRSAAASESEKDSRPQEKHDHTFRIRYRPAHDAIQANDRIEWRGRAYRITTVLPVLHSPDEWLDISVSVDL